MARLLIPYYPLMVSARLASRRSLQAQVDAELDQIQADHVIRPFRRQH